MPLAIHIRTLFFDIPIVALLFLSFSLPAIALEDNCPVRIFGDVDNSDFGKIIVRSPFSSGNLYYGGSADIDSLVGSEAVLSLLTSGGDILWTQRYGTENNDYLTSLVCDPEGSILLAYETYAHDQFVQSSILKLSPDGEILWRTVLAKDSVNISAKALAVLDNGDVVAAGAIDDTRTGGARNSDFYLVKLDSSGSVDWQYTYGGSDVDYAQGMAATSDGGFILVGDTRSFRFDRNIDIYVVKVNGDGEVLWDKVVGDHRTNGSQNIIETANGEYVFVGESVPGEVAIFDVIMGRLSIDGELRWLRHNGGEGADAGFDVAELPDGKFVVTGYSNSFNPSAASDVLIMLTDSIGHEIGSRYLGGSGVDIGYDIELTAEGKMLIAGTYRESDGAIADAQNFLVQCPVGTVTNVPDTGSKAAQLQPVVFYAGSCVVLRRPENFPAGTVISITDLHGREIHRETLPATCTECTLRLSLSPGVYSAEIQDIITLTKTIFLVSN